MPNEIEDYVGPDGILRLTVNPNAPEGSTMGLDPHTAANLQAEYDAFFNTPQADVNDAQGGGLSGVLGGLWDDVTGTFRRVSDAYIEAWERAQLDNANNAREVIYIDRQAQLSGQGGQVLSGVNNNLLFLGFIGLMAVALMDR